MTLLLKLFFLGAPLLATVLPSVSHAAVARWKVIPPEQLAADRPRVSADAGVETLLMEVSIDDSAVQHTGYRHYVRLKVFDRRGVEALDKIEILDTPINPVADVAARVVKPTGEIIEVDRRAIFTRDVLRRGSVRVRAKAFTFPALEPGCIVEYQWYETPRGGIGGTQLSFQSEFPAWLVRYRFRPFDYEASGYELFSIGKNYVMPKLEMDREGFYTFELHDVPAIDEVPWMPPDFEVRSSVVFFFRRQFQTVESFWHSWGARTANELAREVRVTPAIREATRSAVQGVADPLPQLEQLYEFCRARIRNLGRNNGGYTVEERRALKENKSAADTLERGYGTAYEVNALFIALADAAGFEARFARVADRNERFFARETTTYFMLPDILAAVKVGETWQFFDPGHGLIPFGGLAWQNEAVAALICDARQPELVVTPLTRAPDSVTTRNAVLTLQEDGTLEGEVTIVATGHEGVALRRQFDGETPHQCETIVRQEIQERMNAAEVSRVVVHHLDDHRKPFSISFQLRVPGYAQIIGKRLVLEPSVFQKEAEPVFAAEMRAFDLYFPYPRTTDDQVEIKLPAGWVLEDASAPHSIAGGNLADYKATLSYAVTRHTLIYSRHLAITSTLVPVRFYPPLREYFNRVNQQDHHSVVLQQSPAGAPAAP